MGVYGAFVWWVVDVSWLLLGGRLFGGGVWCQACVFVWVFDVGISVLVKVGFGRTLVVGSVVKRQVTFYAWCV